MSEDKKEVEHNVGSPYEWVLKKLLGPTFDEMGEDFASLYKKGVAKITEVAKRKTKNINDRAKANLRVARDTFFNGSFSDEQINAEYFGGILAASRSADGKNDRAIFFLDIIKSLSSSQLKLHYAIYSSFNRLLVEDETKKDFNPARSEQVNSFNLFFLTNDLARLGVYVDADFIALNNKGLITEFEYSTDIDPDHKIHVSRVTPTSLGIQLYAISCNRFDLWREFARKNIDTFEQIEKPMIVTDNASELLNHPVVTIAKQTQKSTETKSKPKS
jgi:hypothetical protein